MRPQHVRLLWVAISLILGTFVFGCGDDDEPNPAGPTWQTPGAPTAVTTFLSSNPDVSPDGTHLAVELSPGLGTVLLSSGVTDTLETASVQGPDWSPDGTKIVVDGGGALAIFDVATKGVTLLGTGDVDGDPAWSPDGAKIAARTTMGGDGIGITTYPGGVWSMLPCSEPDGSGCAGEGPTWSPDGSAIAFEDGLEILRVPSAGGTASVVAEGIGDVTRPAWSPDGQWIAFEVESTGTADSYEHVWIADSRGMQYGFHQITFGPYNDREPSWSPDSESIYFTSSDRAGFTMVWKVAIQP